MQPDKETINGIEYYIGYKGLRKDLTDRWKNYQYEIGNKYSVLDVDLSDTEWSYGLNFCYDKYCALFFGDIVFKCLVPISKDNRIYFGEEMFRSKEMILFQEVDTLDNIDKIWNQLSKNQRDLITTNSNF